LKARAGAPALVRGGARFMNGECWARGGKRVVPGRRPTSRGVQWKGLAKKTASLALLKKNSKDVDARTKGRTGPQDD